MSHTVNCPSVNVLEDLLRGNLVDPHLHDLAEHLEGCSDCQARAKTLVPNDTLVEALRANPVADSIANEMPRNLVEQIKQLPQKDIMATSDATFLTSDTTANGGDADLNFLEPAQQADEIGRLGGYRILKVLGKGGMGVVFLADDPKLERRVAMKVMLPKVASNPTAKDRFLREARAAAKLKSDHIVTIYQVDEANGVPFLAMELLDGRPLDELISNGRYMTVPQVLRIGQEVAKGLDAAHQKGLIHRDIKPANLWLEANGNGRIKILDFGLARAEKDDVHLTQTGAIVGTPAFMAPEQAQGDKGVDARADLFSLGCVLYRLCAGEIPFKGETTMGTLLALAMNTPTAPSAINADIPQPLSELIMQLLEKQPARRPASAKEVVERLTAMERTLTPASNAPDLTAVLSSTQSASTPGFSQFNVSAIKPQKSQPGSKRWIAYACALLLIGGGAFAVYQLVFDTPNGRIVVQIDGDDVDARFKKGKLELYDKDGKLVYTLEPNQRDKNLPSGKYTIKVVGADGLTLDTDKFEMKRGDKVVVRVVLDPLAVASNTGPKVSPKVEPGPVNPAISSLDKLDPKLIPEAERFPWQPKELVAVLGEHRGRHWGPVTSLSFSPDGKTIACTGHGGSARLLDAETLREKGLLADTSADHVAFAPDGKTLASGHLGNGLWLWNLSGAEPKKQIKLTDRGIRMVFSRDGKTMVSCSESLVQVWDLSGEKPVERTGIKDLKLRIFALALSTDGNTLVASSDEGKKVQLWDLRGAEPKERAILTGHTSEVQNAAFSHDGKTLATSSGGNDNTVRLWDITAIQPKQSKVIKWKYGFGKLAWAPDGRTLACLNGIEGTLLLYDLTAPEPLLRTEMKGEGTSALAFAPDGKTLATGSMTGLVRLWDVTGKEPQERVPLEGHKGPLAGAVLATDGKTLVTYSREDPVARLWDLAGATPNWRADLRGSSNVFGVAFSPDGKTLASCEANGTVRLWDLTVAEPGELIKFNNHGIGGVTFAPDGRTLACINGKGLGLWDVSGKEPKERAVLPRGAFSFAPDGKTLVLVGLSKDGYTTDRTLRVWDLTAAEPTERDVLKTDIPETRRLAHSPDGKWLAVAGYNFRNLLFLWRLDGLKPRLQEVFDPQADGNWSAMAFAPDSKTLVLGVGNSATLVDLTNSKKRNLRSWRLPGPVAQVSFTPDGRHLITANANGTAYVLRLEGPAGSTEVKPPPIVGSLDKLDAAKIAAEERFPWQPKELVAVLGEHRGRHWGRVYNLSFSPDGKSIASAGDQPGQIFDAATLQLRTILPITTTSAAYSADRKTLIIAAHTTAVAVSGLWLWDVTGPEPKRGLRLMEKGPTQIALSEDGKRLAANSIIYDKTIHLWDLSGEKPRELPGIKDLKPLSAMALSPDGNALFTGSDGGKKLQLWDLTGPEPKVRADLGVAAMDGYSIGAFSPDGKTLATYAAFEGIIRLWDLTAAKPTERAVVKKGTIAMTFAPDSKSLAAVTDINGAIAGARLFDLSGAEPVERFKLEGTGNVAALSFAPDGNTLATGDTYSGMVRLWDLSGKEPRERVPLKGLGGPPACLQISRAGKTLATHAANVVRVWDMSGAAPVERIAHAVDRQRIIGFALSPDGKTIVTGGDGRLGVWNIKEDSLSDRGWARSDAQPFEFTPDGRLLACGHNTPEGPVIKFWDVSGEEPREQLVLPKSAGPIAISSDGNSLVCRDSTNPRQARMWDIAGGAPKERFVMEVIHPDISSFALSPDGKTLAWGNYYNGFIWDVGGTKPELRRQLPSAMRTVLSPDGKTLAAISNGSIVLWDMQKLLSGGSLKFADGAWDFEKAQSLVAKAEIRKWKLPGAVNHLTFAPDSKHLITANANGTAYVLRLTAP